MRSEAPVDRFRRWTTRFGVGLLLVVVLGALTGTMAVAVSQERVAAYDYDGLSAPAWPDGGSAFAETSPVGRGVGAAVHAYAYDLPVAALVDTGRAQLPGDTFPHALGGEDDTAAPAAEVAGAATTPSVLASTPSGTRALVDAGKYDYLFGNVSSNAHNGARSAQNAQELARVGVHNNAAGRSLLQSHFDDVVGSSNNILRSHTNSYGTFQVRESLFAGPGGFLKFETTWQVTDDGLRLTTVIPIGG